MTKDDYTLLARALNRARIQLLRRREKYDDGIDACVQAIARLLKDDNNAFNMGEFRDACKGRLSIYFNPL